MFVVRSLFQISYSVSPVYQLADQTECTRVIVGDRKESSFIDYIGITVSVSTDSSIVWYLIFVDYDWYIVGLQLSCETVTCGLPYWVLTIVEYSWDSSCTT